MSEKAKSSEMLHLSNHGESPGDDLVPENDGIIIRVFLWSIGVFALAAAVVGAAVYLHTRPGPEQTVEEKPIVLPRLQERASRFPVVPFVDIGREAGIDFIHENGARGLKLLPETMCGGCAFLDFDGDGDQDILLVNSGHWPGEAPPGEDAPALALYRNNGSGKFERVQDTPGERFYGAGAAVGDYDGDGDPDIFISTVGPNHLFRNDGGTFRDVTGEAGVAGGAGEWSTSCGFFDYDRDGRLDLFVCNYIRWSRQIDLEVNYQLTGIGRAYGPPMNFEGTHCYLYHNEGGGAFRDVSAEAGIQVKHPSTGRPLGKALGLAPADVDGDGWIDILVSNDTVQNFFFHNQGDGTFKEMGTVTGLAFDSNGYSTGAMGADSAHFRNDSTLGFAIGNFANEMTSLYVSQNDPLHFTDEAIPEGIGPASRLALTFGVFFFDYDLDGRLDLLQANGHLENEINVVQSSQHYRQPAQLFWNAGPESPQTFAPLPGGAAGDLSRPIVGRGAAYADIDGDGDLDVLLTQILGPPLLLRNDQSLNHHWLRVRLWGRPPNREAIGARVELLAGGIRQIRQVMPARSYLSQVELPVTFGLGMSPTVDSLRVIWPDGSSQEVRGVRVDSEITVAQGG